MSDYLDETREWICNVRIITGVPAKYTPKWELVRCKNCKHYFKMTGQCLQLGVACYNLTVDDDFFCKYGERKQMDGTSEKGGAE